METALILGLFDAKAALIVLGGTGVATVLRCGWHDSVLAGHGLWAALRRPYSAAEGKAELAAQVRDIRTDGVMRAAPRAVHDAEFAELADTILHDRSLAALAATHERYKARRSAEAETAVGVFAEAAELAPVFGMAGTLLALNAMPAHADATGAAIAGAIGLAVLTTLYGILAANLLLAPLARMIQRAAAREEAGRQEVADWLAAQVGEALPHIRPGKAA